MHRPDPTVPYADSIGAIAELLDEGWIELAGISNASVAQIDQANKILGGRLVSVQNQFSPKHQATRPELDYCAELGLAFLPWSPLDGIRGAAGVGERHQVFGEIAAAHGVSPQQVVLAWELSLSHTVIPIPGASRPASVIDSAAATELVLSADELDRLSA